MTKCKPLVRGHAVRPAQPDQPLLLGAPKQRRALGKAVQADPVKPTLKAPGIELSKLKYDESLTTFAFKFNLRRYKWDKYIVPQSLKPGLNFIAHHWGRYGMLEMRRRLKVGRCRLTLSNPRSKRLELSS